jgi:hypothetical protein
VHNAGGRVSALRLLLACLGVLVLHRPSAAVLVRTRGLWLVGLAFLIGTGLARNYDTVDLRSEPWHLVVPLFSSLAMATLMYLLLHFLQTSRPGFWPGLGRFVGLFWLTAPPAWAYGLPWERMLSEADAVRANLGTLAVVSAWRGVVLALLVSELVGWRYWRAFAFVCVVTWPVAMVVTYNSGFSTAIMSGMSGVMLRDAEWILASTVVLVQSGLVAALLAVGPMAFVVFFDRPKASSVERTMVSGSGLNGAESGLNGAAALALLPAAVFAAFLPLTQDEQANAAKAEVMAR